MNHFRMSNRTIRHLAALAWVVSIAVASWVTAELVARWIAPERVEASTEQQFDPRVAAQRIARRTLMSRPESGDRPASTDGLQGHGLTLIGLATGFSDSDGFALIRFADGHVVSATEGENVTPRAVLARILPDRVELRVDGATDTLHLADPTGSPGLPPRTADPSSPTNER